MFKKFKDWLETRELSQIKGVLAGAELDKKFAQALVAGKSRSSRYYLDLGASPNQEIWTCPHFECSDGIMSGEDVRHTPVTLAIKNNDKELLDALLQKGADAMKPALCIPSAGPMRETYPLVIAVHMKAFDCARLIVPHCTVDCLMEARDKCGSSDKQMIDCLTQEIFTKQSQQVSQQAAMAVSVGASGGLAGAFNTVPSDCSNGATLTGGCIETTTPTKKFKKMKVQKR